MYNVYTECMYCMNAFMNALICLYVLHVLRMSQGSGFMVRYALYVCMYVCMYVALREYES